MNLELPEISVALAESAATAFARAGGTQIARDAEREPRVRTDTVEPMLVALGIDDIDPCAGADEAAAAAELCRVAGRVALPYPVEMRLLASTRSDGRLVALRPGPGLVEHGDVGAITAVDLRGDALEARPTGAPHRSRLGPFLVDVDTGDTAGELAAEARLGLVLRASYVLGVCEAAVALATAHTADRIQFDQPLADFQTVRFSLADATVAVESLRAIVHFGIWRCATVGSDALTDALACHLKACDVAQDVLRRTQQLHGASAFPDEHDISVLARHVQARLRVPYESERAALLLVDAIEAHGFDGLFAHGGGRR